MQLKIFKIGILFVFVGMLSLSASADDTVTLHYLASYKGVFSLFNRMDIADVDYQVESLPVENLPVENLPVDKSTTPARQIRLAVSSEHFQTVERLYPFRYLFKSFFLADKPATLFFEHLKTTKKSKKKKHQLGLLDHSQEKVQLFQSGQFDELITPDNFKQLSELQLEAVAARLQLKPKAEALSNVEDMPIDRMTMLELIGEQIKQGLQEKTYLVTNGDELFHYLVTFQGKHDYQLGEKMMPSQKVKIEAFELKPEPKVNFVENDYDLIRQAQAQQTNPEYAHSPVYAWFSLEEKPVALKFVNHHAVGDFIIELKPEQSSDQLPGH